MNLVEKVARAICGSRQWDEDGFWTVAIPDAKAAMNALGMTIGSRACGQCGTVFEYGTGTGRRSTAKFCKPACRKLHWDHANRLQSSD